MSWRPSVLLVAPTVHLAFGAFVSLTEAGCDVTVVSTFEAAKACLDDEPALVVSEIRLAEYNGLHLALRARMRGIPAVVIGDRDPVLQRDAEQLNALFVPYGDQRRLLGMVKPLLDEIRAVPPRTRPAVSHVPFISGTGFEARGTRYDLSALRTPGGPLPS